MFRVAAGAGRSAIERWTGGLSSSVTLPPSVAAFIAGDVLSSTPMR
jgi:hypothetical protein